MSWRCSYQQPQSLTSPMCRGFCWYTIYQQFPLSHAGNFCEGNPLSRMVHHSNLDTFLSIQYGLRQIQISTNPFVRFWSNPSTIVLSRIINHLEHNIKNVSIAIVWASNISRLYILCLIWPSKANSNSPFPFCWECHTLFFWS